METTIFVYSSQNGLEFDKKALCGNLEICKIRFRNSLWKAEELNVFDKQSIKFDKLIERRNCY